MQHFLSTFSAKTHFTKALIASALALIVCSNLLVRAGSEPAKKVDDRLTTATSRFAFKLYDKVLKRRTGSKNTFVSPASVMMALAMTYNGAEGETRQAMARTL